MAKKLLGLILLLPLLPACIDTPEGPKIERANEEYEREKRGTATARVISANEGRIDCVHNLREFISPNADLNNGANKIPSCAVASGWSARNNFFAMIQQYVPEGVTPGTLLTFGSTLQRGGSPTRYPAEALPWSEQYVYTGRTLAGIPGGYAELDLTDVATLVRWSNGAIQSAKSRVGSLWLDQFPHPHHDASLMARDQAAQQRDRDAGLQPMPYWERACAAVKWVKLSVWPRKVYVNAGWALWWAPEMGGFADSDILRLSESCDGFGYEQAFERVHCRGNPSRVISEITRVRYALDLGLEVDINCAEFQNDPAALDAEQEQLCLLAMLAWRPGDRLSVGRAFYQPVRSCHRLAFYLGQPRGPATIGENNTVFRLFDRGKVELDCNTKLASVR